MSNTPFSSSIVKNKKIPSELYLVAGGDSGNSPSEWEPLSDTWLAYRIPESKKHLITSNRPWQTRSQYSRYTSLYEYNTAFNTENQILYLCLHNNLNFRSDEESGLSVEMPSHAYGPQTYGDGYTWLPLWKVDFTEYDYVTNTELPIPKLETETDYDTFIEKYEPLCGSGVTSFGCCCLYFKENSIDQITGEVYSVGDVTNETIFSDCFECQKIAEALDRDVIFLSGVTTGGITSSHPSENPLCPATKTVKTLQEKLTEQRYTIAPNSSKEYQLKLMESFAKGGIMAVNIDLSGVTTSVRITNYENPTISVVDPVGSGAVIRLKTEPYGVNRYFINGIELLNSGSGYGDLPTVYSDQVNSKLLNKITLHKYPDDIYNDPTLFAAPVRYTVDVTVQNNTLSNLLPENLQIKKAALMANPYSLTAQAPIEYSKNDSTVHKTFTEVKVWDGTTIVASELVEPPTTDYLGTLDVLPRNNKNDYLVSAFSVTNKAGKVDVPGGKANGYDLKINDRPDSVDIGDIMTIAGATWAVKTVTKPTFDVSRASFFNVLDLTGSPLGVCGSSNTVISNTFTFSIDF